MAQSVVFDRAVAYYDETRGFPPGVDQLAAATIARAGALTSNHRVVEIGVGTGRLALPLAKHVGDMHGLDLSPAMMLRLREKQTNKIVYCTQGDAARLPYAAAVFDAVVVMNVFHLIPNWSEAVNETARILKPDACLIQCSSSRNEVFKPFWDALRDAIPDTEAAEVGLGWEENEATLQSLGWRVGEAQTVSFTYGRSPAVFVQQLENRIWSRTWRINDEALAAGVAAVREVIACDYGDGEAEIPVHEQFVAKPYYPPQ